MAIIYTTGDGKAYATADETLLVLFEPNILGLITDRTRADVERWRVLHDKGWGAMTASEKTEWSGEMKGRYSYTDMNRVESAVATLANQFVEKGYLTTPLSTKTDWNLWSVPTKTDMQRYLGNVATLRSLVTVYPTTPEVPTVNQRLDYQRANDIEQILTDIYDILEKTPQSWYYSGEIHSGEV
jgi:hypothetical protein